MSESKSIHEIHIGFVDLLKARGEQVVQPGGKPMGHICGYDKTIGLTSAGSIFKEKDNPEPLYRFSGSSTFLLLQDHLTAAYTGVKWENLGLCDAKCWYEAIEYKRLTDANKEQTEKYSPIKSASREEIEDSLRYWSTAAIDQMYDRNRLLDVLKRIRKAVSSRNKKFNEFDEVEIKKMRQKFVKLTDAGYVLQNINEIIESAAVADIVLQDINEILEQAGIP